MKQIVKTNNRKGFTLVETILAVFILVVISSMLVSGFITTMGYSYQTAIYNKSAAMNYSLCMEKTAQWNRKSIYLSGGRESSIAAGTGLTTKTLTFSNAGNSIYTTISPITVGVVKYSSLNNVVPGSLPYMDPRYAPSDSSSHSYVDNRTSFLYYPKYYNAEGDYIVMKNTTDPKKTTYSWVSVPSDTNSGLYTYDDAFGRNVLNSNYNLATANKTGEVEIGTWNTITIKAGT